MTHLDLYLFHYRKGGRVVFRCQAASFDNAIRMAYATYKLVGWLQKPHITKAPRR